MTREFLDSPRYEAEGLGEFLATRCLEQLDQASCNWEVLSNGHLRCLCESPSGDTLELLARYELVQRWKDRPDRHRLLRLLADDYADHPEYRSAWHNVTEDGPVAER